MDSSAISSHVHSCLEMYQKASRTWDDAIPTMKAKLPPKIIQDELGRFQLWTGNIGAHRTGRSSLDYRLREASHIKNQVIQILVNLQSVLHDLLAIANGEKIPWEDLTDSESESSDDEDVGLPARLATEAEQLTSEIAEINTCLMRLSMAIRNPAPHDQFKHSIHIHADHFEPFDIDHVRGKYPNAPEYLATRLGKAISRRRQYLTYREEHRKKLSQGLDERHVHRDDDAAPLGPGSELTVTQNVQSTVASSLPMAIKLSTTTPKLDDDYYEDTLSQTSYASSVGQTKTLRPPPLPEEGRDGEPFECPICYRFATVREVAAWHKHVFRDLQPYLCTFEDCELPDRVYESCHEWLQHEMHVHRRWWECIDGCNAAFKSVDKLTAHIAASHNDIMDSSKLDDIKLSCERQVSIDSATQCPLCQDHIESIARLRRHLGRHLEELALFVLPSYAEESDGESSASEGSGGMLLSPEDLDPNAVPPLPEDEPIEQDQSAWLPLVQALELNARELTAQQRAEGQDRIANSTAFEYLNQVQLQCSDGDIKCELLHNILTNSFNGVLDTSDMIKQVSYLFAGHGKLIEGFNLFLPTNYAVECVDGDDTRGIRLTTPTSMSIVTRTALEECSLARKHEHESRFGENTSQHEDTSLEQELVYTSGLTDVASFLEPQDDMDSSAPSRVNVHAERNLIPSPGTMMFIDRSLRYFPDQMEQNYYYELPSRYIRIRLTKRIFKDTITMSARIFLKPTGGEHTKGSLVAAGLELAVNFFDNSDFKRVCFQLERQEISFGLPGLKLSECEIQSCNSLVTGSTLSPEYRRHLDLNHGEILTALDITMVEELSGENFSKNPLRRNFADSQGWFPLALINNVGQLTKGIDVLRHVAERSTTIEFSIGEQGQYLVRHRMDWKQWVPLQQPETSVDAADEAVSIHDPVVFEGADSTLFDAYHSSRPTDATAGQGGLPSEAIEAEQCSFSIRINPYEDAEADEPSFYFPTATRTISDLSEIRLCRFSERHVAALKSQNDVLSLQFVSFRSKVVSRMHCVLWQRDGKWYIRDTKSSSGTFLNGFRLSQPNVESDHFPVRDGDKIRLGADYREGEEKWFRCVKIHVELNIQPNEKDLTAEFAQYVQPSAETVDTEGKYTAENGDDGLAVSQDQYRVLSRAGEQRVEQGDDARIKRDSNPTLPRRMSVPRDSLEDLRRPNNAQKEEKKESNRLSGWMSSARKAASSRLNLRRRSEQIYPDIPGEEMRRTAAGSAYGRVTPSSPNYNPFARARSRESAAEYDGAGQSPYTLSRIQMESTKARKSISSSEDSIEPPETPRTANPVSGPSTTAKVRQMSSESHISDREPQRMETSVGEPAPRRAPVTVPPRSVAGTPDSQSGRPTKGHAWAFPKPFADPGMASSSDEFLPTYISVSKPSSTSTVRSMTAGPSNETAAAENKQSSKSAEEKLQNIVEGFKKGKEPAGESSSSLHIRDSLNAPTPASEVPTGWSTARERREDMGSTGDNEDVLKIYGT